MIDSSMFVALSSSTVTNGMTAVTTGASDILGLVATVITTITGNPILAALLAAGFVGIAIGVFRKLKRGVN